MPSGGRLPRGETGRRPVERRLELAYADTMSLYLSGDEAADALLTKDPLALLIGMVLD